MKITLLEHHCSLQEKQKEYVMEKMNAVTKHLGSIADNEALEVKVTISYEDTKREDDRFLCSVTIIVPHAPSLHTEVRALSPEAAIDLCENKLRKQITKEKETTIG